MYYRTKALNKSNPQQYGGAIQTREHAFIPRTRERALSLSAILPVQPSASSSSSSSLCSAFKLSLRLDVGHHGDQALLSLKPVHELGELVAHLRRKQRKDQETKKKRTR